MVSDHAQAYIIVVCRSCFGASCTESVALTAHFFSGCNYGIDLVDLVHIRLVLHDKCKTLQTCTGIDSFLVKFAEQRIVLAGAFATHVLIENQVPQLKVAVSAGINVATHGLGAVGRTTIVVPFAAGAGGTWLAGIPEVLFAGKTNNMTRIHADLFRQDVECFFILFPDGHPHALTVEAVLAFRLITREQIPCEVDRAFLEVVAEGEVTVHLEEGTVASGSSNVIDVIGTNALLNRCCPGPGRRFNPDDVGNKRNHSRDGEENRGLRRNKRHRRANLMALGCKVVKPTLTNFRSAHSTP